MGENVTKMILGCSAGVFSSTGFTVEVPRMLESRALESSGLLCQLSINNPTSLWVPWCDLRGES